MRVAATLALAAVLLAGAAETGTAAALHGAAAHATALRDAGDYRDAIGAFDALAARSGAGTLLGHASVDGAPEQAVQTRLAWALSLAARGDVDGALGVIDAARAASLRPEVRRVRATVAIDGARAAAALGQFDVAVRRLDEMNGGDPPADLAAQAARLLPAYEVGSARLLLDRGSGIAAVNDLDEVVQRTAQRDAGDQARALLPRALLAAAGEALAATDRDTAAADLQRLVHEAPGSAEAARARSLLAEPQPVAGTLVRSGGVWAAHVEVRLGSGFHRFIDGYTTSPPYYTTITDAAGDFTIPAVPVGGTEVLEVDTGQGWTTILDAGGNPRYQVTADPLAPVDLAFVVLPG